MSVKSIIDVDINDAGFKAFKSQFDNYQKALKTMPKAWAELKNSLDGSKRSYQTILGLVAAQNLNQKATLLAQKDLDRLTTTHVDRWRSLAKYSSDFAGNLLRSAAHLGKIGLELGSLVTFGGLFGVDKLAGTVNRYRQASQGLGLKYGELRSFELNYQRLVDPDQFLGGVSEAVRGPKRFALYGAGLHKEDIAGRNTAEIASQLIPALKKLADRTPDQLLGFVHESRHLGEFLSLQRFTQLKATSAGELGDIGKSFRGDVGPLGLDDNTQRKWQEFGIQMSRAGQRIETDLITALDKLRLSLFGLSDSFEKTVQTFLKSDALAHWLEVANTALEHFATYIGKPEFQQKVEEFVNGVGAIGNAAKFFGGSSTPAVAAAEQPDGIMDAIRNWHGLFGDRKSLNELQGGGLNNPGNLRPPGASTGFASFPTEQAGLQALARQLRTYASRDHLDTISGIVSKYAPPSENDTAAYINDVSRRTGYRSDQHLNLNDNATLASLMAAIIKHEGGKKDYDKKVIVEVINSTGGNAIVTSNALSRQP